VIHGARKDELSPEVQLAAVHALYNSLEFVHENFEREVRNVKRLVFGTQCLTGRAQLHNASCVRSYPELYNGCASGRVRMSSEDNGPLLR
jgi:hypothetical protein